METLSARDIQDLREAVVQAGLRATEAEANAARVMAINSDLIARNAHLELQNEKMRRALHGPSSERSRRLIDQMELEFEELEATATEDEIAAQQAAAKTTTVEAFTRKRHTRREFPPGLPVERVVIPADKNCPCCGSDNLSKLGKSVIRALETVPAQHKIIETVRERFSCRSCQTITQPSAPFHVTPRAMFGPHFLACLAFNKFGLHQPLNSQRDRLESQDIPLSLSALADQIGAIAVAVKTQVLIPELRPGDVVIMDNLSSHKRASVREKIEAVGATLRLLPPYSPDFNPIEKAFSRLKAMLRKADERTVSGLWDLIGMLVDIFKPDECANYFSSCGYDPA